MDSTIMWGEVVRAEFQPEDLAEGDDRIIVCVAVDAEHRIGHRRVVVIDADYYESTLPTSEDVLGILSATKREFGDVADLRAGAEGRPI